MNLRNPMTRVSLSRRRFLKSSAAGIAAGAFLAGAPAFLRGRDLNSKLNIACIGVGGRGGGNLGSVSGENIVAVCDVNEANLSKAAAAHGRRGKSKTIAGCLTGTKSSMR